MSANGVAAVTASLPGLARVCFSRDLPGSACAIPADLSLERQRHYVVATTDGERVGEFVRYELPVLRTRTGAVLPRVVRPASDVEKDRAGRLAQSEHDTLVYCRQRARELNLAMRPVSVFMPLEREHAVITFAAEERIDFRALLRELGRRTGRRVEFRQVGVRDQAKTSGGWGPCGRVLCCSTFMNRFNSVTIRMAKAQRLSLNPSRISGMCGRLMCCLAHEAQAPTRPGEAEAAS